MSGTGLQEFSLNGAVLVAHVSGALYWPDRSLLAVADLHLEKGSSFAPRGDLLPPYDTAATLGRLLALVRQLRPQTLLFLGDSFHDREGPERLAPSDRRCLAELQDSVEPIWIEGNHDLGAHPPGLRCALEELDLNPLIFRHEAEKAGKSGEVSGHFHPKACIRVSTGSTSTRCFIFDRRRVILPAFGTYTGGLDVRHPALAKHFPNGFKLIACGQRRAALLPEAALA